MKKLAIILLAMAFVSCSNDEDILKNNNSNASRYEMKLINGERTNVTRDLTDPNATCGEVTESGIEQLPGYNANYQWVVVCIN